MTTPTLEAISIEYAYGKNAVLRGVDLSVTPGQILGLVGANGAGKTTLIEVLAGLRRPDAGTVIASGTLGLAPQQLGVYPTLTVRDNLYSFGRLAGLSTKQSKQRLDEVATLLGLTPLLKRRAGDLSGGEQRRLHTGLAVLHEPTLLFVDEPTVGADVASRADILSIIRGMADNGTAVIYTTHYLSELEQLDADVAVLQSGVISVTGHWRELVNRWATESVEIVPANLESAFLAISAEAHAHAA